MAFFISDVVVFCCWFNKLTRATSGEMNVCVFRPFFCCEGELWKRQQAHRGLMTEKSECQIQTVKSKVFHVVSFLKIINWIRANNNWGSDQLTIHSARNRSQWKKQIETKLGPTNRQKVWTIHRKYGVESNRNRNSNQKMGKRRSLIIKGPNQREIISHMQKKSD